MESYTLIKNEQVLYALIWKDLQNVLLRRKKKDTEQ